MELREGGDGFDWFIMAMAHWQRGDMDKAREWYDRAVAWMDKNQPDKRNTASNSANFGTRRRNCSACQKIATRPTKNRDQEPL